MHLLLVEDKDSFRRLLEKALVPTTFRVTAVGDPQAALSVLEAGPCEILVTDLRLPDFSGLELIRRAKRLQPGLRVLLMSAFGEPRDIVEAIRSGADDFLPKPFDLDHFLSVLDHLRSLATAPPPDPREPWITFSPAMRALDASLRKAADSNLPALFLGPRNSGRTRAARRLHTLRSPTAPFVVRTAASLGSAGPDPETLHLAQGGTLLLRDLEDLSPAAGRALRAALEQGLPGSPDLAPARCMATAGATDHLPSGLLERLGVLNFILPPLSQRREDLLPLFRVFLETEAQALGRPAPLLSQPAERALLQHLWPGQFQEMAWCAREALRATRGTVLAALPALGVPSPELHLPWPEPGTLEAMLAGVCRGAEARLITRALEANGRDPARTALALGISPRILGQRLREHRISLEDGEGAAPFRPEP